MKKLLSTAAAKWYVIIGLSAAVIGRILTAFQLYPIYDCAGGGAASTCTDLSRTHTLTLTFAAISVAGAVVLVFGLLLFLIPELRKPK